ncbi:MAG TPA: DUF1800 domain-containing protein [Pirellulaceae bacterium]|nr:DUF1800 domain-containing protein [Pirellulaceae bacterium]
MANLLANLDVDAAWQPFEPTRDQPFDRRAAAHLFRRAGFAATSRELDEAVKQGPQAAVQQLLAAPAAHRAFDDEMRKFAQVTLATGNPELLTGWWLHRMRHTPAPLLEKTTLFWHGHFATSAEKVRDPKLMFEQNELLRTHALGKFEELVRGIARDPAMLLYLDSATNRKIHPNENFAREVMELFALGVGNYSEKDIQELARCFTGWEIQYGVFKFNSYQHDYGKKTVLGASGPMDGDDGLRIILDQPATPEFICSKLVRYFVTDDDELPPEFIAPLAKQFRDAGLTTAPVLQTIFTSRLFYSDAAIGRKIRSPVELGVGLLRSLEATANMVQLGGQLRELGQMVLYPPNVKGWAGGRAWINSSTLLGRANVVRALVENPQTQFGGGNLEAYFDRLNLKSSAALVDFLDELLLAARLPVAVRTQLVASLDGEQDRPRRFNRLLHLFGSLPEMQLA